MKQAGDPKAIAALRNRKSSHLDLCEHEEVEYRGKSTLFEEVELIHDALPEIGFDTLDVGVEFLGKRLRAPLLVTGMTGGTRDAGTMNRGLAAVAERCGIAFGLGSQRIMQRDPAAAATFEVRTVAPTAVVLANLGLTQAAQQPTESIHRLVDAVEADALCLHLNPAQELVQPEGDRDFRGGVAALERLCRELPVPVIVKETGCGISRAVGRRLRDAGVRHVDVSGAGGTSWVRVETLRGDDRSRALGEALSAWGIPTAASLAMLDGLDLELIASGGIRSGVDMAKAIALGARVCGVALPVMRAYRSGGTQRALSLVARLVDELKAAMLLTGASTLTELGAQPVLMGDRLRAWVAAGTAQDAHVRRGE